MVTNVFEAVRKATDPYGVNGEQVSPTPPSASEVLRRLGKMGFAVVPLYMVKPERYIFETYDAPAGAGDEVEAYRG